MRKITIINCIYLYFIYFALLTIILNINLEEHKSMNTMSQAQVSYFSEKSIVNTPLRPKQICMHHIAVEK